jgi:hypothetical protein
MLCMWCASAEANAAVNRAANAVLKQLSVDLSVDKNALVAALQLGILLTTLWEHSRQARAAGWTVPLVGSGEQQAAAATTTTTTSSSSSSRGGHPEHDGVFDLRGLWPYWMSGSDVATVKNDVGLGGFMLLTGPNMAGALRTFGGGVCCSGFECGQPPCCTVSSRKVPRRGPAAAE